MFPRVSQAYPIDNYQVKIVFDNKEIKVFDTKPYLNQGIFKELKDQKYFDSVSVSDGTIQWINGQDFCPDTLYIESKNISENKTVV